MSVVATVESDFSLRKIKIAGICLMGQLFGTSMLLIGPAVDDDGAHDQGVRLEPISVFLRDFCGHVGRSACLAPIGPPHRSPGRTSRGPDRNRPIGLAQPGTGPSNGQPLDLLSALRPGRCLWRDGIGYGKIIGSLFTQHRGKAMALITAFSSIIASIFPQISNQLLQAFGWRGIFTGYGIVILVTGVLLYFLLEEPAGSFASAMPLRSAAEKDARQPAFVPSRMEGMTAAEALRGRTLWIMIGSGVVAGILGAGWTYHSWAFQLSRGFSQQVVANAMTVSLLIAQTATMLGGWLLDKVQTAKIKAPFILIAALSVYLQSIVWANYGGMPLLFVAVTLSTMAVNAQMPMLAYFYTRFFGMKAFGEIAGINMAVLSLVAGFSAPLVGNLYDRTGSYDLAMVGMIVGYVLSALLYLTIGRYRYTTDFKVMAVPEKAA